ncbi:hypothetical protein V1477_018226 [Vespula maculifrons]|uniref:Uncharacterized protein n=1 Tax=Vespula maculifrons TaxID=7453 RepID=A0ABD2AYU7_VESMC
MAVHHLSLKVCVTSATVANLYTVKFYYIKSIFVLCESTISNIKCHHSPDNTCIISDFDRKYYRPRSHHVEVAAFGDPRANGDSTLKFAGDSTLNSRSQRSMHYARNQAANWRRVSPRLRIAKPFYLVAHKPTHDRLFIRFSNQTKSITVGLLIAPENTTPVPTDTRASVLSNLPVFASSNRL